MSAPRSLPLASFLGAHPGVVQVHWPAAGEPAELRSLPRLGAGADVVVAAAEPLDAAIEASLAALRPGGTLALVAPSGGWLGLFGGGGPEPTELAEALLHAGVTELQMAVVPGTLKRWCLVWGEAPRARP